VINSIALPVRIELRAGPSGPACSFTTSLPFNIAPTVGHKVLFDVSKRQLGVVVGDVCHFVPSGGEEPTCLVLTLPLSLESNDDMLRVLDWFKALYTIYDFKADCDRPDSYYSFHRSVIHVLGLTDDPQPKVGYDPTAIKVFAEACRSVLLAELAPSIVDWDAVNVGYNDMIVDLHRLVMSRRRVEPDGAEILGIIKIWEPMINPNKKFVWGASAADCIKQAKLVFAKLRSVPMDRLPKPLRETVE
jgi:hypothetical protein